MDKLLRDITKLAKKHFKNPNCQAWYAKLNKTSWRVFIIDKKEKTIIMRGPVQKNPNDACLTAYDEMNAKIKESLENAIQKAK